MVSNRSLQEPRDDTFKGRFPFGLGQLQETIGSDSSGNLGMGLWH